MNEVVKEKLYLVILLNTTNEDVQKLHWNFFTLFYYNAHYFLDVHEYLIRVVRP